MTHHVPGFASAHSAHITDAVLMMGPLVRRGASHAVDERFLQEPVEVLADLWIGKFPPAERMVRACQAQGENWEPPHEWSTYAFWRVGAPFEVNGTIQFDPDRRLRTCTQLSRLARPTSIGYSRAGRLLTWAGKPDQIIPGMHEGRGTVGFVANKAEDWIRDQDILTLRDLLSNFAPNSLSNRVKRAMMYHEYVHGLRDLDVRWPLVVTAVEALVHTDDRKKVFGTGGLRVTDQFVTRLVNLKTFIPDLDWDEVYLEYAYEHRSSFAHGLGLGPTIEHESLQLYQRLERNLRIILRAAILRPEIASLFTSDTAIRRGLNS